MSPGEIQAVSSMESWCKSKSDFYNTVPAVIVQAGGCQRCWGSSPTKSLSSIVPRLKGACSRESGGMVYTIGLEPIAFTGLRVRVSPFPPNGAKLVCPVNNSLQGQSSARRFDTFWLHHVLQARETAISRPS